MRLKIDPSERWILLGKTGSGKTEWAKYMLRLISKKMKIVIIDPNEMWLGRGRGGHARDWASNKEPGTVDKPRLISRFNSKLHVQLIQPDIESGQDDEDLIRLCYDVLHHGNCFLYFDESTGIATANNVPRHVLRIWKTGRAHNIGAWVSTQAPVGIPKIFKSQAENFISFKVGKEDTDLVASLLHADKEAVESLGKYEWLYYRTDMDSAIWNPPVPYTKRRSR